MFISMDKIGLVSFALLGFHFVKFCAVVLYHVVVGPALRMNVNLKEMGKWAVLNGATNKIGRAYANILAKQGIDVVLIDRSTSKLESLAAELQTEFRINTKIIVADFTEDSCNFHAIESELHGMEIGVLINNMCLNYPHPDYYHNLPGRDLIYSNIIKANIISVTNMTKMIIPKMVHRRKGVIVNVSSTAAIVPCPMLTVFGASMAYIEKFSQDLAFEYANKGIVVQCVMPGHECSDGKKNSNAVNDVERYVEGTVQTIGIKRITTGHYFESMSVGTTNLLFSISPSLTVWWILKAMEYDRDQVLGRYMR